MTTNCDGVERMVLLQESVPEGDSTTRQTLRVGGRQARTKRGKVTPEYE